MKKTINLYEYELPVMVERDQNGGFVAHCSKWQDCYAQADTVEEVLNEITSVAGSLVELYKEEGLSVPLKLKQTAHKDSKSFTLNRSLIISTS